MPGSGQKQHGLTHGYNANFRRKLWSRCEIVVLKDGTLEAVETLGFVDEFWVEIMVSQVSKSSVQFHDNLYRLFGDILYTFARA
jgi:hypothetical protein